VIIATDNLAYPGSKSCSLGCVKLLSRGCSKMSRDAFLSEALCEAD